MSKLNRHQQKLAARKMAAGFIQWLDDLDPALLKDSDHFGEQLTLRGYRLIGWAEAHGKSHQQTIERKRRVR